MDSAYFDPIYRILLAAHGFAGVVALLTFWGAAFAKKGSLMHRRIGKTYLIAMCAIVITAAQLAAIMGLRGKPGIATFLAYLVVITSTAMWLGWRAVRYKRDQARFCDRHYAVVAIVNLAVAAVVFAVGLNMSQALLVGFSVVGFVTGAQMLLRRAKPFASSRWWLEEHFSAMVACGVATHIAFLAIGLERSIRAVGIDPPGWYHLIAWFLPLTLSVVAVAWLRRKYMPKSAAAPATTASA